MEKLYALLTLYEGNKPIIAGLPVQMAINVRCSFFVSDKIC